MRSLVAKAACLVETHQTRRSLCSLSFVRIKETDVVGARASLSETLMDVERWMREAEALFRSCAGVAVE